MYAILKHLGQLYSILEDRVLQLRKRFAINAVHFIQYLLTISFLSNMLGSVKISLQGPILCGGWFIILH